LFLNPRGIVGQRTGSTFFSTSSSGPGFSVDSTLRRILRIHSSSDFLVMETVAWTSQNEVVEEEEVVVVVHRERERE
jgi:hypothetical protein